MASEKTTELQLNIWKPTDNVSMAEFNENFQKIDSGIFATEQKIDNEIQQVNQQLAQTATKQDLQNIGSASPKGVYETLSALETAFPNGTTGIYVVSADGKWYYWNSSSWTPGGIYQAILSGDFPVTNLIKGSWEFASATINTVDGETSVLSSSTGGNGRIFQTHTLISGRKYYLSALVKSTSNKVGIGSYTTLITSHSGSGQYERLSAIRNTPLGNNMFTVIDKRTSAWDNFYVKNAMVVDLTEVFGAGKEPSLGEFEALLDAYHNGYFTGTVSPFITNKNYYEINKQAKTLAEDASVKVNSILSNNVNLFDGKFYAYIISGTLNFQPYTGASSIAIPIESGKTYYIEKGQSDRFRVGTINQAFVQGTTYPNVKLLEQADDVEGNQYFSFKSTDVDKTLLIQVALTSGIPDLYISDVGFRTLKNVKVNANDIVGLTAIEPVVDYFLPSLGVNKYKRPTLESVLTTLTASTYSDVYSRYDALVAAFPNYVSKVELGLDALGNPINKYSFLAPRISGSLKTPKITITCGIHGNEKMSVWALLQFLTDLCYNTQNKNELTYIRNRIDLVVVPIVNPSGYNLNTRQNHNKVNLNRNFEAGWAATEVGSWDYSGSAPNSEAETKILKAFLNNNLDSCLNIDSHNTWVANSMFFTDGSKECLYTSQNAARSFYSDWVNEFEGAVFGTTYVTISSPTYGGSLFDYCKSLGIPSILTEESLKLPFSEAEHGDISLKCAVDLIGNAVLHSVKTMIK